jgi:hypothetical protein
VPELLIRTLDCCRTLVCSQLDKAKTSKVLVMYASAYGNTAALAQAISRGVVKSGVAVDTLNLELASLDDVVKAVKESDGFSIGSPTLGGHMPTPVQVRTQGFVTQLRDLGWWAGNVTCTLTCVALHSLVELLVASRPDQDGRAQGPSA